MTEYQNTPILRTSLSPGARSHNGSGDILREATREALHGVDGVHPPDAWT